MSILSQTAISSNNDFSTLRSNIRKVLIACFIASIYFTGMFQIMIAKGYKISYNPIKIIDCVIHTGFNFGFFFLVFLILSVLFIYGTINAWKQSFLTDKLGRRFQFNTSNQIAGNAHFASPFEYSDLAQIRSCKDARGKIYGQLTEDGSKCIDFVYKSMGSPHVLVCGITGTGKTTNVIYPYALQAAKQRHSVVLTDPKGELYDNLSQYYANQGYVIRRFDLIDPQKSDAWDCMEYLRNIEDPFKLEQEVDSFVTAIVSNMDNNNQDIHVKGSKLILKACVLYVLNSETIKDTDRNLRTLNSMFQTPGNGEEKLENLRTFFKDPDENIASAVKFFNLFEAATGKLAGNVLVTLNAGIQNLHTEIIENILSTHGMDLSLPANQPCAYFCRFSPYDTTYRFVSALFFTLLFSSLTHEAALNDGSCRLPVDVILDEFPSIGIIPGWAEKTSLLRSTGVSALMVVQSFQQLEDNYGTESITIRGNCGAIINIGTNDEVTNQWFVDRLGETSVDAYSLKGNDDPNLSVNRMKLMALNELYQLGKRNCIIVFQSRPPIYAYKFYYKLHPAYEEMCKYKTSINKIPDFYDVPNRNAFQSELNAKVEAYKAAHNGDLYDPPVYGDEEDLGWDEDVPRDIYQASELEILSLLIQQDVKLIKECIKKPQIKHKKKTTSKKNNKTERQNQEPKEKKAASAATHSASPQKKKIYIDLSDTDDMFSDIEDIPPQPVKKESRNPETRKPDNEKPEYIIPERENTPVPEPWEKEASSPNQTKETDKASDSDSDKKSTKTKSKVQKAAASTSDQIEEATDSSPSTAERYDYFKNKALSQDKAKLEVKKASQKNTQESEQEKKRKYTKEFDKQMATATVKPPKTKK